MANLRDTAPGSLEAAIVRGKAEMAAAVMAQGAAT
jgi:hypothetical protein